MSRCGYLHIAQGRQHMSEALVSVQSLRRCQPPAHATLLATEGEELPQEARNLFDRIDHLPAVSGFPRAKLKRLLETPYERTLYLDTDTYCCDSLEPLFDLLDYFDFAMAAAPMEVEIRRERPPFERQAGLVPHNTGVIAYRRSRDAMQTLRAAAEYQESVAPAFFAGHPDPRGSDQPFLALALAKGQARCHVFPNNWNFRACFPGVVRGRVHLIHARIDYAQTAARLNALERLRLWTPSTQEVTPL